MNSALELRFRLRALQRKHQLSVQPIILPLADPVPHAVVVRGIAATCDRDLDRMEIMPGALDPLPRRVPLLLHHNPAARIGVVEQMDYARDGTLRVSVRVEDPAAKRLPAFSVGLRIIACELKDADNTNFHGILHRAELTEITLTDHPSNPQALVEHRIPAALGDFYDNATKAMQCFSKLIQLMQQEIRHHA